MHALQHFFIIFVHALDDLIISGWVAHQHSRNPCSNLDGLQPLCVCVWANVFDLL